jgi:hypothetical protein
LQLKEKEREGGVDFVWRRKRRDWNVRDDEVEVVRKGNGRRVREREKTRETVPVPQ